jgi:hypothetical protein
VPRAGVLYGLRRGTSRAGLVHRSRGQHVITRCTCPFPRANFVFSAIIGEMDEELDGQLDLTAIRAEPLEPVVH